MSPNYWGQNTWIFMHTLAEKIREESFALIGQDLILMLIKICNNLPCPECAQHAKQFWSNVKVSNIKTKKDLIDLLFVFHNMVNKRKQIVAFKYENLKIYEKKSVIETFNTFIKTFHTRGNMNLISESFHRKMLISSLRTWIMTNFVHFNV